jgi:hypothetical protein
VAGSCDLIILSGEEVPCHHGMARTQVADGGDGLQKWRVAANILNKPTRGGPPAWWLGVGLTTPHCKK